MSAVFAPASLEIATKTDPGVVRTLNEDSTAVASDLGLLVLADGMGGYKAGDVASNLAIRTTVDELSRELQRAPSGEIAALVIKAVKKANSEIFLEGLKRMQHTGVSRDLRIGSTLALMLFRQDSVTLAHVGDSRIYRLRDGRLQLLTHDHSLLQEQIDMGMLSADDARTSHNRHLVTRGLGLQPEVEVDLKEEVTQPEDIYLLCSDGLNDMVDDADIELVLNSLKSNLQLAANQLVMIANDHGGEDNVSVLLARVRPQAAALPPAAEKKSGFFARLFGR